MSDDTGTAAAAGPALACPRCDQPLAAASDGGSLRCQGCSIDYPVVAGIPCLFADPGSALAEWRLRHARAVQSARADCARLEAALRAPDRERPPSTARRLQHLLAARRAWVAQMEGLLGEVLAPPAGADGAAAPALATLVALRTRLPPTQDVATYEANVFRDWAEWGEEENALSLAAVAAPLQLAGARVGVLGSGAGRLAYDLHQQQPGPAFTAALDVNPLLARIGQRVSAGGHVTLHEFPLAPRTLEDVAVTRELRAPAPARAGLHFLLGDVRRPPFTAGAFDVLVTPWLVDILDEDFAVFARRANRLLRDGGTWVCFGSLNFTGADPATRYSLEEVCELFEASGFSSPQVTTHTLPYLRSPASRHSRVEEVVVLAGERRRAAKRPPRHVALPDWITSGRDPVPLIESFKLQAASTRIHAFLMSMIDGRRSLQDMARLMEEQRLMPRAEAEQAIRGFLIKMFDEAQAGGG